MTLTSCVNFTNIQSARTLGPERQKDHYVYSRVTTVFVDNEVEGVFVIPEYVHKRKIKNNLDWGFKIGLDASATAHVKYQFLGDYKSRGAMSIMPETGFSLFPVSQGDVHNVPMAWRFEMPILMTFHFTDRFYFTTAPKFLNYYTPNGHFSMLAISSGIQFGKKVNWTFAYSYFDVVSKPSTSLAIGDVGHIFEIGLKFNLFKNQKVFAPRFSFD